MGGWGKILPIAFTRPVDSGQRPLLILYLGLGLGLFFWLSPWCESYPFGSLRRPICRTSSPLNAGLREFVCVCVCHPYP